MLKVGLVTYDFKENKVIYEIVCVSVFIVDPNKVGL